MSSDPIVLILEYASANDMAATIQSLLDYFPDQRDTRLSNETYLRFWCRRVAQTENLYQYSILVEIFIRELL